jgi:hypothetical protein
MMTATFWDWVRFWVFVAVGIATCVWSYFSFPELG